MSSHQDKRGTANWVQCPNQQEWFHVGASLLARAAVKLHCPFCHHEFLQAEALRVVTAD